MNNRQGYKKKRLEIIRKRNDMFRTTLGAGAPGRVVSTHGFRALTDKIQSEAMEAIQKFDVADDFYNDANPEHDFGVVIIPELLESTELKIFWKFDYYNPTYSGWGDPAESDCERVLTIMLSCEY